MYKSKITLYLLLFFVNLFTKILANLQRQLAGRYVGFISLALLNKKGIKGRIFRLLSCIV